MKFIYIILRKNNEDTYMKKIELPSTLDIDIILKQNQPVNTLKKDRLLYLIHLVYYMVVMYPDNIINGWAILNSQELKKSIGNDYTKYLQYLIENKIIERSYYLPGITSYGYRMANVNHDLIHHKIVQITDKTLVNRIKKLNEVQYVISTNLKKNYKYLKKWFNAKLTADIPEDLQHHHKYKLGNITEKRYRMSVDSFGKRLHTNLTNLPKDFRQYLRYNGQSLVEIDIKNSQFYMAIKLLMNHIQSTNSEIFNTLNDIKDQGDKIYCISEVDEFKDIAKYINDVTTGMFYESLAEGFTAKHDISLERDDAKKLMLRVMFSKPNYNDSFKSVFKERYPVVAEIFNQKKRVNKLRIDKYKGLAQSLQRIESGLMLRNICKNEALVDVPMFTIHDSIMTTPDNVELVTNIMITTLTNEIGFNPSISTKYNNANEFNYL